MGGFAGVGRTATRETLMRAADVVLSFPVLLLAMVFLAIARPSLFSVGIIIGLAWGAYLARIVFGTVYSLSGRTWPRPPSRSARRASACSSGTSCPTPCRP